MLGDALLIVVSLSVAELGMEAVADDLYLAPLARR
jgi:hypothetical protein